MNNPLKNLGTPQLIHILNSISGGMELVDTTFKDVDEMVSTANAEFDRRFAERGEYVRLSNKVKGLCGPSYLCGKMVDGVVIKTHYEYDAVKAKSYRRVK